MLKAEEIFQRASELSKEKKTFALVTLLKIKGSAPQEIGAKIIVLKNGEFIGTIGGGKLENKAITFARESIKQCEKNSRNSKKTQILEWNLKKDVGMTCGGIVILSCEIFLGETDWNILIYGAGHVSQELVRLLVPLNVTIRVCDHRKEWLEKLPNANNLKRIHINNYRDIAKSLTKDTWIISITQGHACDIIVLEEIYKSEFSFPYVGVIGSKAKRKVLINELKEKGVLEQKLTELKCPIGLNFGKNVPYEISLSIVSELLSLKKQSRVGNCR